MVELTTGEIATHKRLSVPALKIEFYKVINAYKLLLLLDCACRDGKQKNENHSKSLIKNSKILFIFREDLEAPSVIFWPP